jgi:acetyl esterase/lipase
MNNRVRALAAALVLPVALLLSACQAGFMRSLKAPHVFSAYQKTSVAYGSDAAQVMDVYRPTAARFRGRRLPVIIFFFGGSWRTGELAWYEFFAAHYALKGYVVVVPNYRKAPAHIFPAFLEDAARAVASVQRRCGEWQGDADQLVLMGHSAGAHMAALLLLDPHYLAAHNLKPALFRAFVGLSGPYDFLPMTDPLVVEVFQGDANLPASQPLNFAGSAASAPPMLLAHGAKDALVWPKNSVNLARAVNAAGGKATVLVVPSVGHVSTLFQAARGLHWLAPTLDSAVDRFLADVLATTAA